MLVAVLMTVVGLLAAGCGHKSDAAFSGTTVKTPFEVSRLPLVRSDGQKAPVTGARDKRLTLLYFGYTHCPDICPLVMGSIASALTRLPVAQRREVAVEFVTSDPQRDTPAVLKRYLAHFDPSFVGFTGDLDDIVTVAKSVGIYVDQGRPIGDGGYDPNSHGTYVVGVDAKGTAPVVWDMDTSPSQYASDISFMLTN